MAINRGWTRLHGVGTAALGEQRGWSTVLRPALWFLWWCTARPHITALRIPRLWHKGR